MFTLTYDIIFIVEDIQIYCGNKIQKREKKDVKFTEYRPTIYQTLYTVS